MAYTKDLIDEVKALYPNQAEIIAEAESGNAFLGRHLDDGSTGGISVDTILLATSLDELQKAARLMKRKKQLYAKWHEQDPRKEY